MLRWLTGVRVVLRSVIRRRRVEEELDEEFQYHLEREINERLEAGLAPEEARYDALRAMGAISKSRDECRDVRGTRWLENLFLDFRYSIRSLKRSKGLAAGVVISMGLGLGMTASIFSLVDFFVFRPLPVPQTDRVVRITNSTPASAFGSFSYPEYQDYSERTQSFSAIATYETPLVGLATTPGDLPRVTMGMPVSGNFFSMLQVKPPVGRGFLAEEDSVPGRDAVAVISHKVWQRDFGGSPSVIGREITINGHAFKIVGVVPKDFTGVEQYADADVYFPRMMIHDVLEGGTTITALTDRSLRSARLFARLKPQVTVDEANEDVGRIARQLELEHPASNKEKKAVVLTQLAYRVADDPRLPRIAVVFFTIAALVLGVACVNVSNLLLSTVPARSREMAVRVAMGAPRVRLLRQLLLESAMLSMVGSLVGLVIASWSAAFLSSIRLGSELALGFHPRVDARVVAFTLAVGLFSAFIAGFIPAWRCSRSDLNSLLKSSDPRNQPQKTWGRQILVGAQVAVASLLLVVSGLLLKDLQIAAKQNPGFRVDHILTMSFNPSIAGYDLEKTHAFYTSLIERLRAMPAVRSAAIAQDKPFGVINNGSTNLTIEGYELLPNQQSIQVRSAFVGNGYFETLDIPIIRGRSFDRRDTRNAPRTVIVNETMVERYWPNRDPIGSRVEIKGDDGGSAEVIGIARNAKYGGMDERPISFLYRSYNQGSETYAALFVGTEGDPQSLASAVRTELRSVARNMPVFDIRTMQDHFRENGLLGPRLNAEMFAPMGVVALVLGILGLYGVIAYSVGQRTYEIGIRMAIGASDHQVVRMILVQGLRSSFIAAVVGLSLALALKKIMTDMIAYVSPSDPSIYIGVLLLMLLVTGAACYVPARRASMIDPNVTLRN